MSSFENPELLIELVESPEFGDSLHKVANHTIEAEMEAGFAVYSLGLGFRISELVYGDYWGDFDGELVKRLEMKTIIHDQDDHMRDDILFTLHSHPESSEDQAPDEALVDFETYQVFEKRQGPFRHMHRRHLVPSLGDMMLYQNINEANPGHVSAILTSDREVALAGLLMYRHPSDKPQALNPINPETLSLDRGYMFGQMVNNGYRYVNTVYDLANQQTPDTQILQILF
ncbi:MAG TPA: hypothetical protein VLF39_03900 [Candidatus Saccharimonadales bacterium]|nr:hypothetical protein [Candidatus Saccharimonadales bacterium]